jgi:hypothetical protein
VVFSIQRFLEDLFARGRHDDPDQYAIALANLYDRRRREGSREDFLGAMRKLRTSFFRVNGLDRSDFEERLAKLLDQRFKKKLHENPGPGVPAEFETNLRATGRAVQRAKRRSIRALLQGYARSVESSGVEMFWDSRTKGRLKPKPETIARDSLAVAVRLVLGVDGLVLREFQLGTGFVDVGIVMSALHIVEMKILTAKFTGAKQLGHYLRLQGRREGWLVVIDARPPEKKAELPAMVELGGRRRAHVISADINPVAPSSESA